MATLPPSADITGGAITEGQAKTWLTNVRTFIAALLGTDGTQPAALAALGAPWHGSITKSGAYTVVAADRGKVIKCSGTWTLSFTEAATLGDGFYVEVVNDGSGVITLDANSSELIDTATTLALAAGKSVIPYCDGSKFLTWGRGGVETFNTRSGAVTLTSADITDAGGALASNAMSKDMGGSCPVGCIIHGIGYVEGSYIGAGATEAGSGLFVAGATTALPGTWRNIGNSAITGAVPGPMQRIA